MTDRSTAPRSASPEPDPSAGGPAVAGAGTAAAGAPAAAADTGRTTAGDRLVIGLLLVSAFVVILNETIMSVAIPDLIRDLGITATDAQWLTTAFMLTMAVVIPITGFLLQRFTTRQVFLAAMTLFSIGTAVAAMAPGYEVLLGARVIQASGTAIMMPLLMTTVMTLVAPSSRGRTMGNISVVISVAPAIGPTISGLILESLDWRWMFIFVLPIALAALALGAVKVRNVGTPSAGRIDVVSVILSAIGFGGFVFGLSNLSAPDASPFASWGALVVGIAALVVFGLRQRALSPLGRALLDLRVFASRTFSLAVLMLAVSMMALFGTLIILPLYLRNVLGLAELSTGLLLLPGGLVMGIMSPFVGRAYDRFGPRMLVVPGSIVVSIVFWMLTMVGPETPVPMVLGAHVMLSVGLALLFTPLFTTALGSLTPDLYSHGSAVVGTVQQVAGAAGTALFVSVMAARTATLGADGTGVVLATAGGVQAAFTLGAIVSIAAIVVAFFIRAPKLPEGAERPAAVGH